MNELELIPVPNSCPFQSVLRFCWDLEDDEEAFDLMGCVLYTGL
jgi:hypothetical protein